MSHEVEIHQAQTHILRELLFVDKAGFAVLQKPTGLESDHFKFHIKRLLELGYVEKVSGGQYRLSLVGKEYANKLDTDNNTIERQPKCAVILVIEKTEHGQQYILAQQRRKHPYFGFWGCPSGKIRWGETILLTAARELFEETGLRATCTHMGIYHEHAIETETGRLLEDKIFHTVRCSDVRGELKTEFEGGLNAWFTPEEALAKEKKFGSFELEIKIGLGRLRQRFIEAPAYYSSQQF
ncbi:MAG TPA: NUDIX hydrolase [Candidatus Acidoferrum sp.]|nr:NUDIX hydrolase [Candidatus Acidoferrum sp.]